MITNNANNYVPKTYLQIMEDRRDDVGGIDVDIFSPLQQVILMYLGITGDRETAEAAANELEELY